MTLTLDDIDLARKAGSDGLEHKAFIPFTGVKVLDEEQGIVQTIVAVTNVEDKVKDIYLPGAFEKSLRERTMKGMRGHDWSKTVAKALEQKELRPGDPALPPKLLALNAGALVVTAQYNMNTQPGREAFEDVKFFGEDQEWSVGYRVDPDQTKTDRATGIRRIGAAEMHEFSDVPFGAMPLTGTLSVKSLLAAQDDLEHDEADTYTVGPFEGLSKAEVEHIKERARAAAAAVAYEKGGTPIVPGLVFRGTMFSGDRIVMALAEAERGEGLVMGGKSLSFAEVEAGLGQLEALIAEKGKPDPIETKDGRVEGSWEDRQDDIQGAISAYAVGKYGGGTWCYLVATFDDHVIANIYPGPSANYVDKDDGDGDITLSFPYQASADGENVMLGTPTEVELTTSVAVASKALRVALEAKAGRVLKNSNADHLTQAIGHLVEMAKTAGISADDLVSALKEGDGDEGKGETKGSFTRHAPIQPTNPPYSVKPAEDDEDNPHAVVDGDGKEVATHPKKADAQDHADALNAKAKEKEKGTKADVAYTVAEAEGDLPFAVVHSETGKVKAKHPTRARARAHARELNSEDKAGTCQCPDAEQADAVNGVCAYCGKPVPAKSDEGDETKVLLSEAELLMFEHLRSRE